MAELLEDRVERLAPREVQPDTAVARQITGAGQDEVARSRKAHEGFGPPAERQPERRELGEPARDKRRPRVQSEPEAVADPGGGRHHVFDSSADLDTGDIRA